MTDARAFDRRAILTGRVGSVSGPAPFRALPPGALAPASCTACTACVSACPTGIVSLAGGLHLDFTRGECTFCGDCATACPEPVFDRTAPPRARHRVAIGSACLTHAGVVCHACGDACPEQAIRFVPRRGGPFLPSLRAAACTGCGACIARCPTEAITPVPHVEEPDHV